MSYLPPAAAIVFKSFPPASPRFFDSRLVLSRMAVGPWTGTVIDAAYAANALWYSGDVVEASAFDEDGKPQGSYLMVVVGPGGKARLYKALVLAASDSHYEWWVNHSGEMPNPGIYRCCQGKGDDAEPAFKGNPVVPVYSWRILNWNGTVPALDVVDWVKAKERSTLEERITKATAGLSSEAQATSKEVEVKRARGEGQGDGSRPVLVDCKADDICDEGGKPKETRVEQDLGDLRASLERDPDGRKARKRRGHKGPEGKKDTPGENAVAEHGGDPGARDPGARSKSGGRRQELDGDKSDGVYSAERSASRPVARYTSGAVRRHSDARRDGDVRDDPASNGRARCGRETSPGGRGGHKDAGAHDGHLPRGARSRSPHGGLRGERGGPGGAVQGGRGGDRDQGRDVRGDRGTHGRRGSGHQGREHRRGDGTDRPVSLVSREDKDRRSPRPHQDTVRGSVGDRGRERSRHRGSQRGCFESDPRECRRARDHRGRSDRVPGGSGGRRKPGDEVGDRRRRSSSRSSSASVSFFRGASPADGRRSQIKLQTWVKKHPGRAAARVLQHMEDLVGRDGEQKDWGPDEAPASAKSYYLRVLQPRLAGAGLRNLKEMKTLCTVLDHMALGRSRQAADVVAARLKALEYAGARGNWSVARFLELIEDDEVALTTKEEEYAANREAAFRANLESRGSKFYGGSYNAPSSGRASGQDAAALAALPPGGQPAAKSKGKGKGKLEKARVIEPLPDGLAPAGCSGGGGLGPVARSRAWRRRLLGASFWAVVNVW